MWTVETKTIVYHRPAALAALGAAASQLPCRGAWASASLHGPQLHASLEPLEKQPLLRRRRPGRAGLDEAGGGVVEAEEAGLLDLRPRGVFDTSPWHGPEPGPAHWPVALCGNVSSSDSDMPPRRLGQPHGPLDARSRTVRMLSRQSIASPDKGRSHGMARPRHGRDGREGWQSTDCLRHSPMPIDIQVGEDACHGLPVPQVGGDACVCGTGRPWPGVDLALDDEAVELRQQPRPPLCSPPPPHLDRAVVGQGSLPSRPAKARHAPHTRSRRRKRAADAAPTCVARERLTRPAGRMSARRRGRSEAAADARVDIKETGFGGGRRACRIRTSRRAPMPAAQQVLNLNQFFSSLILDSEL